MKSLILSLGMLVSLNMLVPNANACDCEKGAKGASGKKAKAAAHCTNGKCECKKCAMEGKKECACKKNAKKDADSEKAAVTTTDADKKEEVKTEEHSEH
jgi:hypothetical protein